MPKAWVIKSGNLYYNENTDEFGPLSEAQLYPTKERCEEMIKDFSSIHYWGWADPEDEKRFFEGAEPSRVRVMEV